MIDVDSVHLEVIQDILKHYVPDCEVRAFGSRYKWTAKSHSDLDLALIGKQKRSIQEMAILREAFEESILPFRVDVLDWHAISTEFQQVIEQGYEVIQKPKSFSPLRKWRRVKLKECAKFQEGYVNPSQTVPEYFGNDVKWLRANDLNNSYVHDTSRRLSKKGFESAGKSALLFKPDTLAISKSGTIGRLGILKDFMCGNRAVINIEVDNSVCDNLFIFYSLLTRQKFIEDMGTGSVQKNLYVPVLAELEIPLPPLPTQRRIADILSALDEKIELNRQTNASLEAIAQAIFKEWFVDFNYPGATGEMVESELGMIPLGWRVGNFLEIASLLSGGTPKTQVAEYWDGQIKWVSAKDVSAAQGTFVFDTERKITPLGVKNSSAKILPELTTIVTARGTVGSYCILAESMAMNQTNYGLKAKIAKTDYFVFFSLSNLVTHLRQVSYGTIFDTVTTKTFEQAKIEIPPVQIMESFDKQVSPIMQQILNNIQESTTLAAIRDALLPKLMNGEIPV